MASMEIEHATATSLTNPDEAINTLSQIIARDNKEAPNDEEIKTKEHAIFQLASILSKEGKAHELAKLIRYVRPFLSNVSKAKAAKIVQTLLDKFLEINALSGLEIDLCKECIDWAKEEKRIFLRQALEAKLLALYYETKHYDEALLLSSNLLKELKKMDDKRLLVEVQLLESKVYHALGNLPKSRASLTSARTTANSIYCPPKMQAALDLQSGIGHAAEEKDFKTAYSYLYEAFEGYESIENRPKIMMSLKYMLLCKIMLNCPEEVESMVTGKLALKYPGPDMEAMRALAIASRKRSLADFQKAIDKYGKELMNDPTITTLLKTLYDKLLEQNLLRIIEPYSKVQVVYISTVMELPLPTVEKKLSQMILDKKFLGIIDQGEGVLIVFDERTRDDTFETAVNIIECMSKVVDTLYVKAKKLS